MTEYRQENRRRWQTVANGWEKHADLIRRETMPVTSWMIEAIAPQPGDQLLEIAAGIGDTGFLAAELIEPGGVLITSDLVPEMLSAAQRRAEALGVRNVRFRQIDAESIDQPAASLDGVLCRWGYMLMADPAAALTETRRVLRDGGRLSLSVWGAAERNPWASLPAKALMEHTGAPRANPTDPGIFAMADPGRVRSLVQDAGFAEPRLDEVEVRWRFEDFDAYWRYVTELAGGIAMVLQAMPETDREAVRKLVERAAGDYRVDGGLELPGVALNASAE